MPEFTPANIFPSVYYDDPDAAIAFLVKAFGFKARLIVRGPDGGIIHSELTYGPGVVMVGPAKRERNTASPKTLGGFHGGISVQVDDPDAHHAHAKACGGEIVQELRDEAYGSRGYQVRDPGGHVWCFATYRPGAHWTA